MGPLASTGQLSGTDRWRPANKEGKVPPRWFVRFAWYTHRGLYRITGGRVGLWRPKPNRWGAMRLTITGRRTGEQRSVILGYYEDGPNLVTMAMNGWADDEPSWWLNLQTNPVATVAKFLIRRNKTAYLRYLAPDMAPTEHRKV